MKKLLAAILLLSFSFCTKAQLVKLDDVAKIKNSKDLANGVELILNLPRREYQVMSKNCRRIALETYGFFGYPSKVTEILTKYAFREKE